MDHGLFQAICRVNRLDTEDKEYGYIVDYKDLFKSLNRAVKDYTSEALDGFDEGDKRAEGEVVLHLNPKIAPIKVGVFPLVNKDKLPEIAKKIYEELKEAGIVSFYDDSGSIGRRYRRQDEIGTPWCVTVDFETLKNKTVTIRDRDTLKQERVKIKALEEIIFKALTNKYSYL